MRGRKEGWREEEGGLVRGARGEFEDERVEDQDAGELFVWLLRVERKEGKRERVDE